MARAWPCELCGHVHQGDSPPENCPICGAEREAFTPLAVVAALRGDTGLACELAEAVRTGVTLARLPGILANFPQLATAGC